MVYLYTEVFLIKGNIQQMQPTIWMSLKNIMLSEKSDTKGHILYLFHLPSISRRFKYVETKSESLVARGWVWEWGLVINGYEGPFGGKEKVLTLGCCDGCTLYTSIYKEVRKT